MKTENVRSNITGTVAYFDVDDGDKIEAGKTIMSIECMKTMYPVTAPVSGLVSLRVELGELVENDALVATIRTE